METLKIDSTLYIDEAGDLGFGKGTDWFVLSGVLVLKEDERQLRNIISHIRNRLNINEIHFHEIRAYEKKCYIASELNKGNFVYMSIVADTRIMASQEHALESPCILSYNQICCRLIECVASLLDETGHRAEIVLSSRGTSRDGELIAYLKDVISGENINPVFGRIRAKTAPEWDMLQLADVCATSMYNLHQIGHFGFTIPCYAYRLYEHIYKHDGQALQHGIRYYDDNMNPGSSYFAVNSICRK